MTGRLAAAVAGLACGAAAIVRPTGAEAQDTFVYQAMPTFNFDANGFDRFLVIGKSTVPHDLNALIRFDVAGLSLAADARATLHLWVGDTTATGFPGVSPTPAGPGW